MSPALSKPNEQLRKGGVRRFLVAMILFGTLASIAWADTPTRFIEANASYKGRDFKNAALAYEELAAAGHTTPALYYDLGNSYLRLGKKGKAIVAYERALRAAPRDPDVRWNLDVVKSGLPDRIEEPYGDLILMKVNEALAYVSVNEAAWAFTLSLGVIALLMGLALLAPGARAWTRGLISFAVLFAVFAAGVFAFEVWKEKDALAVLLDREVVVRYGPSENESKAFLLHEGAEARVTDSTDDWFFIRLANGHSGWVPKRACEIV